MYLFVKDFSQLPPRCQQLQRRDQNQNIQKPLRWFGFGVGTKILLCDCVFGLESRATKKQTLLHAVNSIQPNPNQLRTVYGPRWLDVFQLCRDRIPLREVARRAWGIWLGRRMALMKICHVTIGDVGLFVTKEVENSNPLSMSFLGLSKPWKVWSAVLAVETFRASKMCMPCPGDDPVMLILLNAGLFRCIQILLIEVKYSKV